MEKSTEESLKTYEDQVKIVTYSLLFFVQTETLPLVEAALAVSTDNSERSDLLSLSKDLRELIRLTKDSTSSCDQNISSSTSHHATDSEFDLFMSEMEKEGAVKRNNEAGCENDADASLSEDLKALEGSKCRAPHKHQWGDVVYHNAMICSISPNRNENDEDVEVGLVYVRLELII